MPLLPASSIPVVPVVRPPPRDPPALRLPQSTPRVAPIAPCQDAVEPSRSVGSGSRALGPDAAFAGLESTEAPRRRAVAMGRLFAGYAEDVPGNLVLSPYSVLAGLAPVYAGAAGSTQFEIGRLLGLGADVDASAATSALGRLQDDVDGALRSMGTGEVALSLWLDTKRTLSPTVQARIEHAFRCSVATVALGEDPKGAADQINAWSHQATHGQVPEILAADDLEHAEDGLVLLSAIHVDAAWRQPFVRESAETVFTDETGGTRSLRMLSRTERDAYCETADFSAVIVPYKNDALQMEFVLPHADKNWRDALLDGTWVSGEIAWTYDRRIALRLPSFDFDSRIGLKAGLRQAGVVSAFDKRLAELDPLSGSVVPERRLYLDNVLQRAKVTVDEEGTRAAAVTACIFGPLRGLSRPALPVEMRLDRPFLFLMRHRTTQEIIFMGKVGLTCGLTDAPTARRDDWFDIESLQDGDEEAAETIQAWYACYARPGPIGSRFRSEGRFSP